MSEYEINLYPVAVSDEPDAHRVVLKIDNQSFNIGDYYESLEFAEGMKDSLVVALDKLVKAKPDAITNSEDFENWAVENNMDICRNGEGYMHDETQYAWQIWRDAEKSMQAKLDECTRSPATDASFPATTT